MNVKAILKQHAKLYEEWELEEAKQGNDDDEYEYYEDEYDQDRPALSRWVIAVRSDDIPEFSDWVPIASVNARHSFMTDPTGFLPQAIGAFNKVILEAGGMCLKMLKKLDASSLQFSYEEEASFFEHVYDGILDVKENRKKAGKILGVGQGADTAEIKRAFAKKRMALHADSDAGEDKLLELQSAYSQFNDVEGSIYESLGGKDGRETFSGALDPQALEPLNQPRPGQNYDITLGGYQIAVTAWGTTIPQEFVVRNLQTPSKKGGEKNTQVDEKPADNNGGAQAGSDNGGRAGSASAPSQLNPLMVPAQAGSGDGGRAGSASAPSQFRPMMPMMPSMVPAQVGSASKPSLKQAGADLKAACQDEVGAREAAKEAEARVEAKLATQTQIKKKELEDDLEKEREIRRRVLEIALKDAEDRVDRELEREIAELKKQYKAKVEAEHRKIEEDNDKRLAEEENRLIDEHDKLLASLREELNRDPELVERREQLRNAEDHVKEMEAQLAKRIQEA